MTPKLSNPARAAIINAIQEDPRDTQRVENIIQADLAPRVIRGIDLPFGPH
jgi:hypothetical protein